MNSRSSTGWSWRRLPWSRSSNSAQNGDNSLTYQGVPSSADSQYGFSNRSAGEASIAVTGSSGSYSILDNRPPIGGVYVWGPPPPYSNPNSPARRVFNFPAGRCHHSHDATCHLSENNRLSNADNRRTLPENTSRRHRPIHKDNYENTGDAEVGQNSLENGESTDSSSCQDSTPNTSRTTANTLPARKVKKKIEVASVKSTNQSPCRTNVKQLFEKSKSEEGENKTGGEHNITTCRFLPRLQGVENAAFQKQESPQKPEATESEVYFADVSSCCNISVRNDGQDSSLYDEAIESQKARLSSLQCIHKQNEAATSKILKNFQETISTSTVTEDEEYLINRMGKNQMSIRSRLPFPLPEGDDMFNSTGIPKDISQSSLCSVQTPLTETTDDTASPVTPLNECCFNGEEKLSKRSFSSLNEFLAPDAQYEVIKDNNTSYEISNLASTISNLSNFGQSYMQQNFTRANPPKTLNLNPVPPRKSIGENI